MSIVIFPPTIDWDYMKQRPQHLMSEFAKAGYTVFFLNKNHRDGEIFTSPLPNLYVVNHLPFFRDVIYPKIQELNIPTLYWSSWSKQLHWASSWGVHHIVYDCVDDFPDWEQDEATYTALANFIVCTADNLERKMKQQFPQKPVYKVPNGCEWDYFAQVTSYPKSKKLDNLPKSDGPVIGYIGAWASWVDEKIVQALSRLLPQSQILIIGPNLRDDHHQLAFGENVFFLGHVDYSELVDYLEYIDVCILPFKINRITESTNPIKIYEYLAAGKPVVSTALPELLSMSSLLYLENDEEKFAQKVMEAYKNKDVDVELRSKYAKLYSWQARFEYLDSVIAKELPFFHKAKGSHYVDLPAYYSDIIRVEHITVNSYYKDLNLLHDPIFLGKAGNNEYQTLLKIPLLKAEDYKKVYLELDGILSPEIIGHQLMLSLVLTPWVKEKVTFANKPEGHYWQAFALDTGSSTISIDITSLCKAEFSLLLSSDSPKPFALDNARVVLIER